MRKLILFTMVLLLTVACNKESSVQPTELNKVYWGNAIYNPSTVTRDYSTFETYPMIMPNSGINGDVIVLQPKLTLGLPSKSADEMIIGDTCYSTGVNNNFGLCYLYNITTKVKGCFITNRLIQLDTCSWSNHKLISGTMKLNDDNSVDVEYTDSTYNIGSSHYTVHYTK